MKRKWDSDNEMLQKRCIDEVIARLEEIGDSPIGVIAAQEIIDIVTANLAPEIYNRGLRDARKLIATKLADLDVDLDTLEQHP